jgi:hypothetical protein
VGVNSVDLIDYSRYAGIAKVPYFFQACDRYTVHALMKCTVLYVPPSGFNEWHHVSTFTKTYLWNLTIVFLIKAHRLIDRYIYTASHLPLFLSKVFQKEKNLHINSVFLVPCQIEIPPLFRRSEKKENAFMSR